MTFLNLAKYTDILQKIHKFQMLTMKYWNQEKYFKETPVHLHLLYLTTIHSFSKFSKELN